MISLNEKIFKLFFWLGYAAVLFVSFLALPWKLSTIHLNLAELQLRLDHLLHFSVYFLICMYYLYGRRNKLALFKSHSLLKFLVIIIFLATVSEIVQLWVPSRSFNPMDGLANVTGIFIGVLLIQITKRNSTNHVTHTH